MLKSSLLAAKSELVQASAPPFTSSMGVVSITDSSKRRLN